MVGAGGTVSPNGYIVPPDGAGGRAEVLGGEGERGLAFEFLAYSSGDVGEVLLNGSIVHSGDVRGKPMYLVVGSELVINDHFVDINIEDFEFVCNVFMPDVLTREGADVVVALDVDI